MFLVLLLIQNTKINFILTYKDIIKCISESKLLFKWNLINNKQLI